MSDGHERNQQILGRLNGVLSTRGLFRRDVQEELDHARWKQTADGFTIPSVSQELCDALLRYFRAYQPETIRRGGLGISLSFEQADRFLHHKHALDALEGLVHTLAPESRGVSRVRRVNEIQYLLMDVNNKVAPELDALGIPQSWEEGYRFKQQEFEEAAGVKSDPQDDEVMRRSHHELLVTLGDRQTAERRIAALNKRCEALKNPQPPTKPMTPENMKQQLRGLTGLVWIREGGRFVSQSMLPAIAERYTGEKGIADVGIIPSSDPRDSRVQLALSPEAAQNYLATMQRERGTVRS